MKLPFYIAIALAIGFVILSLPNVYIFTDSIIPKNYLRITFDNCPGVPTTQGIIVHAILFLIYAFVILYFKFNNYSSSSSSSSSSSPPYPSSSPPKIEKKESGVQPTNNLKTSKRSIKRDELPIRRKLPASEPIEMDPFEMYDDEEEY